VSDSKIVFFSPKRILVFVLVVIFVLVSCQAIVIQNAEGNDERVFSLGFVEAIDSLNPYIGILDSSYVYYGMVYDYLTWANPDLKAAPHLASSWWYMDGPTAASIEDPTEFSTFSHNATPDDWPLGSVWEFNLTEKVFWSDGEPFTADDVEWTINIQIGLNFMTYWAYQPSTRWIDHAEAINDNKVRVFFADLDTKFPFPAAYGDFMSIPIMPEHLFEDKEPTYMAFNWDGIPAVGTGPFTGTPKLRDEFIAKEVLNLVPNPYFNFVDDDGVRKGLGAPYDRDVEIDNLKIKFFGDENTRQLAIRSGDIDAGKLDPGTYRTWLDDSSLPEEVNILSMLSPTGFTKITAINANPVTVGEVNPLRLDPVVQRAMAIATNKSYIIDQYFKGQGLPGISSICTPVWPEWYWEPGNETSWFNVSDGAGGTAFSYNKPMKEVMEFDLELANDMLNKTGYDQWTGGSFGNGVRIAGPMVGARMNELFGVSSGIVVGEKLEFEIVTVYVDLLDRQLANYHKAEWVNIGVDAEPEYVNDAEWGQRVYNYAFNIQMTYWSGDLDPNYLCFIATSYTLGSWNDFGVNSEEYDQLYLNQAKTLDMEERLHWVYECQKWQYLSGSIITTVFPKTCYAYRNDTWTNWGDWEEHPGLAIDHFWGAAPIFFTIKYQGGDDGTTIDPLTAAIAATIVAAAIAVIATLIFMRKRKQKRLEAMEDEEYRKEETA